MPDLFLHGRQLNTIFDLLGDKENDVTFSIGWAFARCSQFLALTLQHLFPDKRPGEIHSIHLQRSSEDRGYTDIEILTSNLHVIVEAKRGWVLPSVEQLTRYTPRFATDHGNAIAVMADCTPVYAKAKLPAAVSGIPVTYLSWSQVSKVAHDSISGSGLRDKNLLRELHTYLEGLLTMQDQNSNMVYVVSLSKDRASWSTLSWIEIVTDKAMYFHPMGTPGWPRVPANYLGFRYRGKLQSIHHVESYKVIMDLREMATYIPEIDGEKWASEDSKPHFLYMLGPAIIPNHDVKTGDLFHAAKAWAALDLLLTCSTISQASDITKKRHLEPEDFDAR